MEKSQRRGKNKGRRRTARPRSRRVEKLRNAEKEGTEEVDETLFESYFFPLPPFRRRLHCLARSLTFLVPRSFLSLPFRPPRLLFLPLPLLLPLPGAQKERER